MLLLSEAIEDGIPIKGDGVVSCNGHTYMGEIENIDTKGGYVYLRDSGQICAHAWSFYEVVKPRKKEYSE